MMEINKFTKLKNGKYKILFGDHQEITVYEDLILKYELLLHKQLDEDLLEKIQKENQVFDTYYIALKYLNVRPRSEKEVQTYLSNKQYPKDSIVSSMERLREQGYLNDEIYAKLFVRDQQALTNNGPNKMRMELSKRGVESSLIEQALMDYSSESQKEKIDKMIQKMIRSNHTKSNTVLKKKMLDDLVRQGFDSSAVSIALRSVFLPSDSSLRDREYEKVKKKLERKYKGKELEYKIKQKMYQKGFYDEM